MGTDFVTKELFDANNKAVQDKCQLIHGAFSDKLTNIEGGIVKMSDSMLDVESLLRGEKEDVGIVGRLKTVEDDVSELKELTKVVKQGLWQLVQKYGPWILLAAWAFFITGKGLI
jgi:hypothetical protein